MEQVNNKLQELLSQLEALLENRTEMALAVVSHKQSLPERLQTKSSEIDLPLGKPIKENPHHQNQLSELLTQTYTMLKKYGEAADTTAIREAGFQWMLEDYSIEAITEAFKQYLKIGKEIPTPADIIEILDPTVKPLCPRMYSSLIARSKKGSFELTREEWKYVEQYENQQLTRLR